jgi:DNA modification methylase
MKKLLGGRIALHSGDCLEIMDRLPASSVHAAVTDGPYHLPEMAKRFGSASSARSKGRIHGEGAMGGFHGKAAIVGDILNRVETWQRVFRVLKPGGHLAAFNAVVPYAHMQVAAEAAGFETRTVLMWLYGTGLPRGKPLGKFVDRKLLGAWCDDDELARGPVSHSAAFYDECDIVLKPAVEMIMLARKPIEGSIGDNLIKHGTGALNINACRVQHETGSSYPANLLHDGSGAVTDAFPTDHTGKCVARFFWSPKASEADRAGSGHPTIKPLALMQWLVRLVSQPGQTVIDPFAGSGTTGEAAWREGRRAVLIEIDPQFQRDIVRRMAMANAGPEERKQKIIKATAGDRPFEAGSLFASI